MIKRIVMFFAVVFCINGMAYAGQQYSKTSGELMSSGVVTTASAYITSMYVLTDGTNAAKGIVYNGPVATGSAVVGEFTVPGATGQDGRAWPFPTICEKGIYVVLSGTGASCIVEYMER